MKVIRLSVLRNGRFYPGTNFCSRLSRPHGHSAAGRITSMKNYTIGNRTRDLPACSAVPQPTATPRAPSYPPTDTHLFLHIDIYFTCASRRSVMMSTGADLISNVGILLRISPQFKNVLQLPRHFKILTSISQKTNCYTSRTSISCDCRSLPCKLVLAMNKTSYSVWFSCTLTLHPVSTSSAQNIT
jgi:hypothetical protein